MISTFATVLIPHFASRLNWHFYVFLGLRFLQVNSFPKWIPYQFQKVIVSYSQCTAYTIILIKETLFTWPNNTSYFIDIQFQGISFGADFAAIGLITVHWASLKQHGFFISLLTSFSQISVMFTMPVSGEVRADKFKLIFRLNNKYVDWVHFSIVGLWVVACLLISV